MTEDISAVQSRWLSDRNRTNPALNTPKTPDIEAMDIDTYSKSMYAMNDSLHDLQNDIQRIAQQQSQIQQMMQSPRYGFKYDVNENNKFWLSQMCFFFTKKKSITFNFKAIFIQKCYMKFEKCFYSSTSKDYIIYILF